MAKKSTGGSTATITIPEINTAEVPIVLVGSSPLIMHRFDEKTRKQMEAKNMKKANKKQEARDPHAEFLSSAYVMPGSQEQWDALPEDFGPEDLEGIRFGFPAAAFKNAFVSACRQVDGMTMTFARQVLHVMEDEAGLVELGFDEVVSRTDVVRIARGTATNRYRAEFRGWRVSPTVWFNQDAISLEQVVNLFNMAGFASGIGEWRPSAPSSSGPYGMFSVESVEAAEKVA